MLVRTRRFYSAFYIWTTLTSPHAVHHASRTTRLFSTANARLSRRRSATNGPTTSRRLALNNSTTAEIEDDSWQKAPVQSSSEKPFDTFAPWEEVVRYNSFAGIMLQLAVPSVAVDRLWRQYGDADSMRRTFGATVEIGQGGRKAGVDEGEVQVRSLLVSGSHEEVKRFRRALLGVRKDDGGVKEDGRLEGVTEQPSAYPRKRVRSEQHEGSERKTSMTFDPNRPPASEKDHPTKALPFWKAIRRASNADGTAVVDFPAHPVEWRRLLLYLNLNHLRANYQVDVESKPEQHARKATFIPVRVTGPLRMISTVIQLISTARQTLHDQDEQAIKERWNPKDANAQQLDRPTNTLDSTVPPIYDLDVPVVSSNERRITELPFWQLVVRNRYEENGKLTVQFAAPVQEWSRISELLDDRGIGTTFATRIQERTTDVHRPTGEMCVCIELFGPQRLLPTLLDIIRKRRLETLGIVAHSTDQYGDGAGKLSSSFDRDVQPEAEPQSHRHTPRPADGLVKYQGGQYGERNRLIPTLDTKETPTSEDELPTSALRLWKAVPRHSNTDGSFVVDIAAHAQEWEKFAYSLNIPKLRDMFSVTIKAGQKGQHKGAEGVEFVPVRITGYPRQIVKVLHIIGKERQKLNDGKNAAQAVREVASKNTSERQTKEPWLNDDADVQSHAVLPTSNLPPWTCVIRDRVPGGLMTVEMLAPKGEWQAVSQHPNFAEHYASFLDNNQMGGALSVGEVEADGIAQGDTIVRIMGRRSIVYSLVKTIRLTRAQVRNQGNVIKSRRAFDDIQSDSVTHAARLPSQITVDLHSSPVSPLTRPSHTLGNWEAVLRGHVRGDQVRVELVAPAVQWSKLEALERWQEFKNQQHSLQISTSPVQTPAASGGVGRVSVSVVGPISKINYMLNVIVRDLAEYQSFYIDLQDPPSDRSSSELRPWEAVLRGWLDDGSVNVELVGPAKEWEVMDAGDFSAAQLASKKKVSMTQRSPDRSKVLITLEGAPGRVFNTLNRFKDRWFSAVSSGRDLTVLRDREGAKGVMEMQSAPPQTLHGRTHQSHEPPSGEHGTQAPTLYFAFLLLPPDLKHTKIRPDLNDTARPHCNFRYFRQHAFFVLESPAPELLPGMKAEVGARLEKLKVQEGLEDMKDIQELSLEALEGNQKYRQIFEDVRRGGLLKRIMRTLETGREEGVVVATGERQMSGRRGVVGREDLGRPWEHGVATRSAVDVSPSAPDGSWTEVLNTYVLQVPRPNNAAGLWECLFGDMNWWHRHCKFQAYRDVDMVVLRATEKSVLDEGVARLQANIDGFYMEHDLGVADGRIRTIRKGTMRLGEDDAWISEPEGAGETARVEEKFEVPLVRDGEEEVKVVDAAKARKPARAEEKFEEPVARDCKEEVRVVDNTEPQNGEEEEQWDVDGESRQELPWPPTPNQQQLPKDLKRALRTLTHPVAVITTINRISPPDESPLRILASLKASRGVTVSSFNTVTLEPTPIVSFNLKLPSRTWDAILFSKQLCVHLLTATSEGAGLADMFTRPYEQPGEPFRRIRDAGTPITINHHTQRRPPAIRAAGVAAQLIATLDEDKCVHVGDHVVVMASVKSVRFPQAKRRDYKGVDEDHGLAYAMRGYRGIGGEIEVAQVSDVEKKMEQGRDVNQQTGFEGGVEQKDGVVSSGAHSETVVSPSMDSVDAEGNHYARYDTSLNSTEEELGAFLSPSYANELTTDTLKDGHDAPAEHLISDENEDMSEDLHHDSATAADRSQSHPNEVEIEQPQMGLNTDTELTASTHDKAEKHAKEAADASAKPSTATELPASDEHGLDSESSSATSADHRFEDLVEPSETEPTVRPSHAFEEHLDALYDRLSRDSEETEVAAESDSINQDGVETPGAAADPEAVKHSDEELTQVKPDVELTQEPEGMRRTTPSGVAQASRVTSQRSPTGQRGPWGMETLARSSFSTLARPTRRQFSSGKSVQASSRNQQGALKEDGSPIGDLQTLVDNPTILSQTIATFLSEPAEPNLSSARVRMRGMMRARRESERASAQLEAALADGSLTPEESTRNENIITSNERYITKRLALASAKDLRRMLDTGSIMDDRRVQWLESSIEKGLAVLLQEAKGLRKAFDERKVTREEFEKVKAGLEGQHVVLDTEVMRLRQIVDEEGDEGSMVDEGTSQSGGEPRKGFDGFRGNV